MSMKRRRLILGGLGSMVVLLLFLSTRCITLYSSLLSMEAFSSFLNVEEIKPHFTDIHETVQITFNQQDLPSEDTSKLSLVGSASFKLGDHIRVEIRLRNDTGSNIARGGDVILCWMINKKNRASLTGSVVDHLNGSYTGVIRAMWIGSATIKCAIGCTREGFHMMMNYFKHHWPNNKIFCIFENNEHKVKTIGLTSARNGSNVCNLTTENYGIPWYCVRPGVAGVQCSDWTKVSHDTGHSRTSMYENKTEMLYFVRATSHRVFTNTININIQPEAVLTLAATKPCGKDDLADTWKWTSPVGYFYNNTWRLANCRLNYSVDYHKCFQNRRMILIGDSTVRQWFTEIFQQLELRLLTQTWNVPNWHRQSVAFKEKYNFTLVWTKHGLPIYFGETNRGNTRPVYVHLDQIPPGSNHIILINLYAHFQYHNPAVVRRNLKMVVSSLRSLLRRSPNVRIAMKGSHYFSLRDKSSLGGMWGPLYDSIIRQEFRGLYSKVHFIDLWDMTVAEENYDVHPSTTLVKSIINVFLSYACIHS